METLEKILDEGKITQIALGLSEKSFFSNRSVIDFLYTLSCYEDRYDDFIECLETVYYVVKSL